MKLDESCTPVQDGLILSSLIFVSCKQCKSNFIVLVYTDYLTTQTETQTPCTSYHSFF